MQHMSESLLTHPVLVAHSQAGKHVRTPVPMSLNACKAGLSCAAAGKVRGRYLIEHRALSSFELRSPRHRYTAMMRVASSWHPLNTM